MNINRDHLFWITLATLTAIVLLALVPSAGSQGNLGGSVGLVDALTGAFLIEVGAIAGAKVPK